MAILHRGSAAPEDHHFVPFITYSSPSRTILARILVASEEATSGSVMLKHERISPFSKGFNHFSFCSSVPNWTRTSMFPVSGALQLKTSGAILDLPIISHKNAYSKFVSPAPYLRSVKNKFHSPCDFAFFFKS